MTSEVKLEPTADEIEWVAVAVFENEWGAGSWPKAYPRAQRVAKKHARAAILAVDRRAEVAGEPDAWQRYAEGFGWTPVNPEDLDHYRGKGVPVRPLYASPPAPAVAVPEEIRHLADELTSFAFCVNGEVGNGSFAVIDKTGADSELVARNLRAVLRDAAEMLRALAAAPEPPATRSEERPPYPEGEVVGPCVCGSWPGGRCLRCEWRPATRPEAEIRNEGIEMAAKWHDGKATDFEKSETANRINKRRAERHRYNATSIRALKERRDTPPAPPAAAQEE